MSHSAGLGRRNRCPHRNGSTDVRAVGAHVQELRCGGGGILGLGWAMAGPWNRGIVGASRSRKDMERPLDRVKLTVTLAESMGCFLLGEVLHRWNMLFRKTSTSMEYGVF